MNLKNLKLFSDRMTNLNLKTDYRHFLDLSSLLPRDVRYIIEKAKVLKVIAKENNYMPVGFQFNGRCILQEAQKKLKASNIEQSMAV